MTEAAIQSKIQASIQSMAAFEDAQVTINDNSIIDAAGSGTKTAVYAIIYTSDDFDSTQEAKTPENTWNIPVMLIVAFVDWKTSLDAMTTLRDALLTEINSTTEANRSAAGLNITSVRSESPIDGIYDQFVDFDDPTSVPDFLSQRILFIAEEY